MQQRVYRTCLGTAALAVCCIAACRPAAVPDHAAARVTETRRLMGVPWTITLYAASPAAGRAAIAAGFAEASRLERILSDYDPTSELSRLSAAAPTREPIAVGGDLWQVLDRAVTVREATAGAFDPTVGALTTLWRQSRRSGRLPRDDKLAAALGTVGPGALVLVPERRGVRLPRPGTRLDLGGIGMGYAADRVLEVLAGRGIRAAMIDASGDIAVSGPPPGAAGWRIAVDPLGNGSETAAPLILANAAVTTSGDAFQAVEIEGRRYSHIVDPRTGLGATGPAAVTVIAPDCTTADALATAASVLGPQAGLEAVGRMPGCAARFVWQEAGQTRQSTTSRWPAPPAQSSSGRADFDD